MSAAVAIAGSSGTIRVKLELQIVPAHRGRPAMTTARWVRVVEGQPFYRSKRCIYRSDAIGLATEWLARKNQLRATSGASLYVDETDQASLVSSELPEDTSSDEAGVKAAEDLVTRLMPTEIGHKIVRHHLNEAGDHLVTVTFRVPADAIDG